MLSSLPIAILVGIILGFLAALGIGGGTLLVLWLTQIIGMDPSLSKTINLLFFIAAASSASLIRLQKKAIPWRRVMPAIISGCIAAFIFTMIAQWISTEFTGKLLGCLMLITGFRELFYRDKKAR